MAVKHLDHPRVTLAGSGEPLAMLCELADRLGR
jgi:hypothetical protein